MSDCIFCKIASGQIPSGKVYEDDFVFAFLDISPANKGHTLVVTKKHFETFTDIPDEIVEKLCVSAKKIAGSVVRAMNADGFNLLMNNKKVSGQIVPHAHFHIIPRFENDAHKIHWEHKKYSDGEMQVFADKIKNFL